MTADHGPQRIQTLHERCIGAGNCAEVAPSYFDQDESDGTVRLLRTAVAPGDEDAVAEAADICPVSAILTVDKH
jgi:ferredoxin